ncbi:MAG: hypothetical protein KKB30_08235 [Proteobacteria bacterium]|nr:hypothetical protein [Pseudomonadota bacterium]MBU1714808.1 hypothetical protein [Pseudomonadota bacterium]
MESIIYLATSDESFALTLCQIVAKWGFIILRDIPPETTIFEQSLGRRISVVLLDIRQHEQAALQLLQNIKEKMPEIEAILINRSENVRGAMTGMQAGAEDEIIAPFDTAELKKKIMAACRRHKKRSHKKESRSLFDRFSDSMAAATFAQAGEFETAVDFLDGPEPGRKQKKKSD